MTHEETAAQHVRNAIQILSFAQQDAGGLTPPQFVWLSAPQFDQVIRRLNRAVAMLENQSQPIG